MAEIEVPPFFLCPISLQIMKDPVTVSTGISYDRDAIERWISASSPRKGGAPTCPVTNQALQSQDLTPNITLRRLIQSWCTLHAVDRLPTPKTPRATRAQIKKLLEDITSPPLQLKSLQALKSISAQSQTNRRSLKSAGAAAALATVIVDNTAELSKYSQLTDDLPDSKKVVNEALSILYSLQLSESSLKPLTNSQFVETLTLIMQHGSYDSRAYAVMLLNPILEGSDPYILINLPLNFFAELGQILKDQISEKATKSALETLISSCQWGPNRIKAANSGVVPVLIELLLDSSHRRASEMSLMVLDLLCQCAEGRSALLNHRAGLAIISKKILRVSRAASESAVRVLHSISRFSATREVLKEMLQIGVVKKLCLVIQVDCGAKTREKAKDVLRTHARVWKSSAACIPSSLMSLYPA